MQCQRCGNPISDKDQRPVCRACIKPIAMRCTDCTIDCSTGCYIHTRHPASADTHCPECEYIYKWCLGKMKW
jgi:hypothetical protein